MERKSTRLTYMHVSGMLTSFTSAEEYMHVMIMLDWCLFKKHMRSFSKSEHAQGFISDLWVLTRRRRRADEESRQRRLSLDALSGSALSEICG